MTTLPRRSEGVLAVRFGPGVALFDPEMVRVHVLTASAALVWDACDGRPLTDLVGVVAELTGTPEDVVAGDVEHMVAELVGAGLVGREVHGDDRAPAGGPPPAPEPAALRGGVRSGAAFAALDEVVAIVGDDVASAGIVDDLLAPLACDRTPTAIFTVVRAAGGLRLAGRGFAATFADPAQVRAELMSLINRVVSAGAGCLALHAGAAVHPSGGLVLLPASSGSGKSTLTAALVASGWRYVTDEAVGVRPHGLEVVAYPKPLALDATSRALLGLGDPSAAPDLVDPQALGDAVALDEVLGPPDLVLLPTHRPGTVAPTLSGPLPPEEALVAVAPHALNLGPAGGRGLEALSGLAATVPCHRLDHGDLGLAVAAIARTLSVARGGR